MQFYAASAQLRMVARPAQPWTSSRRIQNHRHAFHELALVLEGECHWRIGGRRRVELGAGDILLLPPQRLHREEVPAGATARMLWVGFAVEQGVEFPATLLERPLAAGAWAGDLEALSGMLYREHQRPELPGAAERAEALLRVLFVTLHRIVSGADGAEETAADGRHGAALRAAAHTLRRNLAQPPRVAELARQHGLTPGHFSMLFVAAHGRSPREFLQAERIGEASRRLREGAETVKEIAAACGYGGAPHFCRAFKAATGLSPRAWRRRAGEPAAQGLPS